LAPPPSSRALPSPDAAQPPARRVSAPLRRAPACSSRPCHAPPRRHRRLCHTSSCSAASRGSASPALRNPRAMVGKGGRSRMEPRKCGSASPSEAARGSGTSSTPGASVIFTVWEGSAWSRSWSRSQSPHKP
jgi:hypothetical protein